MGHGAAGFWSYAHEDDEQDGGRIRRLAEDVKREYSLITGTPLDLFIDRDLAWGDEWRARIDQALSATTFFIPVLTPRYFTRPECRRELLTFVGHARSLGREDLLLSILYVPVAGFDDDDVEDDAVEIVKTMQWEDWRKLRLEAPESQSYRTRVNALATRLADIRQSAANGGAPELASPSSVAALDDDDEPGVVELVAEAEEAFPKFNDALEAMGAELETIGQVAVRWTPRLIEANKIGAAAAIPVYKSLAAELTPPAERLEGLGGRYSGELLRIDPAVLSLIRMAEYDMWDREDAEQLFIGVYAMSKAAAETVTMLNGLIEIVDQVASISRDARRPLRTMKEGLKHVVDGQTIVDEWERRAAQAEQALGWTERPEAD